MRPPEPDAPVAGETDLNALLAACSRGQEQALQRIYELTAPSLLGIALRIVRRRDAAEDVVHDAFLQIWRRAGSFDPAQGAAQSWLIAIVRYRALDSLRRQNRRKEASYEDEVLEVEDPRPTALDQLAEYQELAKLKHCIEVLPQDTQRCILLAYSNGYTHEEIAEHLTRPLGTVKSWIRRGLLSLRSCLQ